MTLHRFMSEEDWDRVGRKVEVFNTFEVKMDTPDTVISKSHISIDRLIMLYGNEEIHKMMILESTKDGYDFIISDIKTTEGISIAYWYERDAYNKICDVILIGNTAIRNRHIDIDFIGESQDKIELIVITCSPDSSLGREAINIVTDAKGEIIRIEKCHEHNYFVSEQIKKELLNSETPEGRHMSCEHKALNNGNHMLYKVKCFRNKSEEYYYSIIIDVRNSKSMIFRANCDVEDLSNTKFNEFNGLIILKKYLEIGRTEYMNYLIDLEKNFKVLKMTNKRMYIDSNGLVRTSNKRD